MKRNCDGGNLKLEKIDKILMNPVISGSVASVRSRNGFLPESRSRIFFNYDNIRFCGREVANYNSLKVTAAKETDFASKNEIQNGGKKINNFEKFLFS